MQPELALQRLEDVRSVVDGEVEELVDSLATIVMLQQDIEHPMLGANVTLYRRPETEDRREVPASEAPEPDSDDWNWQWGKVYGSADSTTVEEDTYYFTPKVDEDAPDLVEHEAIVIEGNVSGNAPDGELWDPNVGEYRTADDYPLGTVNVVVAKRNGEYHSFSDGYCTDVEVFTSITPVDEEPRPAQYTPGWP